MLKISPQILWPKKATVTTAAALILVSGLQSLIDIPIIGTNLLWTKVFGISSHHQWIDTLTRRRNILTKFHIWQFAWQQTQRDTVFSTLVQSTVIFSSWSCLLYSIEKKNNILSCFIIEPVYLVWPSIIAIARFIRTLLLTLAY